jgi:hypothetical protein
VLRRILRVFSLGGGSIIVSNDDNQIAVRHEGIKCDAVEAENLDDEWRVIGDSLSRVHKHARLNLFTPFRVQGSPPGRELHAVRVTKGVYQSGETFERADSFRNKHAAHFAMNEPWTGVTTFFMKNHSSHTQPRDHTASGRCEVVGGSGSVRVSDDACACMSERDIHTHIFTGLSQNAVERERTQPML